VFPGIVISSAGGDGTRRGARRSSTRPNSAASSPQAVERLQRAGIPFRLIAEVGDPAERNAAVAASEGVDEILAGSGKQSALQRYAIPAGLAALILVAE
jgi:hypothetical protein